MLQFARCYPIAVLAAISIHISGCEFVNPKGELERKGTAYSPAGFVKAAAEGRQDDVILFLRAGMPLDSRDDINATPLYRAASNGHRQVVEYLLSKGAGVDVRGVSGFTPLIAAASDGHTEIVQLLASRGANINAKNNDSFTALHWAAANNHVETIRALLDLGADPSAPRWANGGYAADEAFVRGHVQAARIIVQRGGRISR